MKAKEYLRTIQKLESEIRMPLKPLRNLSLTLWTRRLITQFIVFI